jgi:uncharacterized FlaG/YvyC family protein
MGQNTSPAAPLEARLAQVSRVETGASSPKPEIKESDVAAEAAEKKAAQHMAELKSDLAPADLLIELDKAAGRFVNTLVDSDTHEVILRYPNETQLAFARAVNAYLRAISR